MFMRDLGKNRSEISDCHTLETELMSIISLVIERSLCTLANVPLLIIEKCDVTKFESVAKFTQKLFRNLKNFSLLRPVSNVVLLPC